MVSATVPAVIVPTVLGVPMDFILFGVILLGVAIFHHHTFRVAIIGLSVIVAYKFMVTGFKLRVHLPLRTLPVMRKNAGEHGGNPAFLEMARQ